MTALKVWRKAKRRKGNDGLAIVSGGEGDEGVAGDGGNDDDAMDLS